MSELFLTVLRLCIHAALLAVAVMVLRLALKKAPKAMIVALWGLVALRLICPFTVEFRLSAVPESIGTGQILEDWSETLLGEYETIYEGQPAYLEARRAGILPETDPTGKHYVVVDEDRVSPPRTVKTDVVPVLFWLWLAGVIGMLLYMAFSYGKLHKLTAQAVLERENIYRSEAILSPFLMGVIRPRICLPVGLENPDMAYVLAHEQAHIARKDHWWKAVGFWILCIHWFNPVLWISYLLFCKDIELACDEYVARKLDREQLADYSQALLNCSLHQKRSLPCPLAFGETGVKERVKKILGYQKPGAVICVIAAVAVCVCAVFLMTGSRQEQPQVTEPSAETSTTPAVKEDPVWMTKPIYLSSNTFFVVDRELKSKEDSCSWRVRKNGQDVTYTLVHDPSSRYINQRGGSVSVYGSNGDIFEMVVISTRLESAELLACDGRYAYFCEPWSAPGFGQRIVRLDLKTFLWETLVEAEQIWQISIVENTLMYYLACEGDTVRVCRMYLPEKLETEYSRINLDPQTLTLKPPQRLWEEPQWDWKPPLS